MYKRNELYQSEFSFKKQVIMRLLLCVAYLAVNVLANLDSIPEANLTERFKWKYLDYAWPSEEVKQQAIENGEYIPENNIPVGISLWGNKMFIGNPRWRLGRFHQIPPNNPS